ncbi:leucine-rich repeat-containing protein 58 [Scaptodrosophila lebanonensis]|uniref:Leucine-rich repeat-containing protein 58 n=1 Tax=Drosophila lebanonensis TaxID=7225 RepID=A0A6J2TZB7_DROLE|nr:leucine-rich repeat-containing protein 58 [Scaptodrosophila lebanonensis]XP_030381827.1 leucine-rich repeat-containing protein 58 [Scaptodrosophila lebanonensis]
MMEVYTSDSSDTDSREQKTLDFGRMNLDVVTLEDYLSSPQKALLKSSGDIETMLLNHNRLAALPKSLRQFGNLKVLDLSSNALTMLPDAICQLPLVTLIAKNNLLTNASLPKSLLTKQPNGGGATGTSTLKELNLSGNQLTHFPEQVTDLRQLKYLYVGGNKISTISKDIWKMQSLHVLSLGGNQIIEVPEGVGLLAQLQALVLCDNLIEHLPMSIARLKNLKSLLLHKNRLKHLPKDIVALKNLTELSLRDNPLVVRFVQDMALNPPTLLELAGRIVKSSGQRPGPGDLPRTLIEYLNSANCCVNPNCKGVFFDNRVEHIKFVDFCGKYRVPLLQYLCSSKCIEPEERLRAPSSSNSASSGFMMRKVLLG